MKKVLTVMFKNKFSTVYNSTEYSYYYSYLNEPRVGDLVIVDTQYGLEIAKVVRKPATPHQAGLANKYVMCVLEHGKIKEQKPPEPKVEAEVIEQDTGMDW